MKTIILGEHQGDGIRYEMYLSAPAGGLAQMIRNPEGNWVGYAEYAALKAEVERLTKERDHYQWASTNDGIACNERARENQHLENQIAERETEIHELLDENERLRKAGDELARVAIPSYILDTKVKAIEEWNAAKKVQP
jgi:NAD(P)-dependent dehydrogenase (short-subunit alcohol dehydrogenase family)